MSESRLITKKELAERHPALGDKPYRLDWLVRQRMIPIVKIGRRIYFDTAEIDRWLENQQLPVEGS